MSWPGIPRAAACVTHLMQGTLGVSERQRKREREGERGRERESRKDIFDVCGAGLEGVRGVHVIPA